MNIGERIILTVERPAAGGRMIARHDGAVVFVSGAIPGEVVEAVVEKVQRGTIWAAANRVIDASPDRVEGADTTCGGCLFAHVRYERQRALKAAIIEDAFRRIGRIPIEQPVEVMGSPVDGYRMRARLHVRGGRVGFFREGTHDLCDAGPTRQLHAGALAAVTELSAALQTLDRETVSEIELSENIDGTERACHLELAPHADPSRLATLSTVTGLTGASCAPPEHRRTLELWGHPFVADTLSVAARSRTQTFTLRRHARSFFQGNRYLLVPLVEHVLANIEQGPVVDLFAGAGLFSVAAAVAGFGPVIAVEGDRFAIDDLRHNAAPSGDSVMVRGEPVEAFLARVRDTAATVILDPPRTGLSKEAVAGVIARRAGRLVYVSCDVATLARDARILLDAGYAASSVRAFDLFPNTAHVETVMTFSR